MLIFSSRLFRPNAEKCSGNWGWSRVNFLRSQWVKAFHTVLISLCFILIVIHLKVLDTKAKEIKNWTKDKIKLYLTDSTEYVSTDMYMCYNTACVLVIIETWHYCGYR